MPEYITKERAMDCVYEAVKATDANAQDLYAIRRKIAKEPGIGWVSVKDRMPKERQGRFEGEMESDFVLCCAKSEKETIIDMGYTVNGEWECESGYVNDYCEVTHWMPFFPKPPEEVNGDA